MARSFSQEPRSDSHKIGETRYRMSHLPSIIAIARTLLLAGILLAVTVLAARSFFPAFAQEVPNAPPTTDEEEIDYDENGDHPVVVYAATDPEGEAVFWSIVDASNAGPDAEDFDITNGVLTFDDSPDYESPTDRVGDGDNLASDNTYVVQVRASDTEAPGGNTHTITVTIDVQNVNELGEVTFSHPQPKEGTAISVTLTDDDRAIDPDRTLTDPISTDLTESASTTWQWFRSESRDGPWGTPIATSTDNPTLNNTRTPEAADVGHYLRATAMYFDGEDTDEKRTAHGISANKVLMEEYINTAPVFRDDVPDVTGQTATQGAQINMSVPEDESLEEGDPAGQPIAATDIGEDGSQEVLTYSVTPVTNFTIDSASGQLKLAAGTTLDAETTTTYIVTVRATDPSGLFSVVTVTINITGVDEAPTITGGNAEPEYLENTQITTPVEQYTAADDEGETTTLSWEVTGTNSSSFVKEGTGTTFDLQFLSSPNYEALSSSIRTNGYKVTVNVTDSNGNTGSLPVTVMVTNFDETERVTLSHPEARVGTSITARLSDEDKPFGITWSWSQNGSPIDGATGSSYRPTSDIGTLVATASYTDNISSGKTADSSGHTVVAAVSAIGTATNTAPTINDPGTVTVLETAGVGTEVVRFGATDADGDSTFLYKLTSGSSWFDFNELTGALTTKIALNHEQRDSYTVTVTATDSSLRTGSGRRVTIGVDNVDEDPVIAEGGASVNYPEIKNGNPNTDPVFRYTATDDEDNNANLRWTLSSDAVFELSNTTGANNTLRFQSAPDFEDGSFINPATVTITVTDSDGDSVDRSVSVNVTNVDEPGMVTGLPAQPKEGVEMTVMLVDDPDGPVTGQDDTLTDNASTTWEWYRSRSRTSGWALISATSSANIVVNTNTRTPEAADVGHYLRATARYSDGQSPDKVAHGITTRTIQAKEYVNSAPVFRDDVPDVTGEDATQGYQINMMVNEDDSLEAGDPVGDPVTATDIGASQTQETLIYELINDPDTDADNEDIVSFTIDRLSGQLKLAGMARLDEEDTTNNSGGTFVVTVKAIDPAMASSTALVTIQIIPVDEAPEFDPEDTTTTPAENLAATSTVENTATTTVLSSYTATDDEDGTTELEWTLEGADEARFALCHEDTGGVDCTDATDPDSTASGNPNTVTLRFKEEPNFEAPSDSGGNNEYNVTVVAKDSDEMMAEKTVTVKVTNENEGGTVTLSHIQPEVGTAIRASLTDLDGGVSGTTWEWFWCATITTGTTPECVTPTKINTTSSTYTPIQEDAVGDGSVGRYLQAKATYTDKASGAGQPKRMASKASDNRVQADDATNQPPVLPDVAQTLEIRENSEDTDPVYEVGTVVATDPDDVGTLLLYTLSGTDAALFTIHSGVGATTPPAGSATSSTAGMIRLKRGTELDHETKDTYRVTVTATDPSLAMDTVDVIIEVTNVNEPPTVSQRGLTVTGPASVSYAEDRTDAVQTYNAVGPDASGASWSLSGADAGAFSIPGGVLSFNSQPDHEALADSDRDSVYNITITATMGTFSDTLDVTVTVTDVDEDGTINISSPNNEVKVGVELTAELDEGDEEVVNVWQWASGPAVTGPWSNISGATSNTYTPIEGDVGNYLQITVTYTDAGFGIDSLSEVAGTAVEAASGAGTPGTVSLSPSSGLVSGNSVTATLTDPDTPTNQVWQWDRSADGSTNWTTISGATSATYTTTDDDAGNYLRASVTYDDDSGSDNTAGPVATTDSVAIDSYDANRDGTIDSGEVITAVADYFRGVANGGITVDRVLEVVALYFRGLNN